MKKILTLILLLGSINVYAQIVVETDTITVGNTSGAGGVSLFGKAYLKNTPFGSTHDSVLVQNANGSIRMVPRSSFGSGGPGAYLPLAAGAGNGLTGTLYTSMVDEFFRSSYTGTGANYMTFQNAGGVYYVGIDNVSGGGFANGAYAFNIHVPSSKRIAIKQGANTRYLLDESGNHDFKSGTATFGNDITLNNTDANSFHGMTFTNNGNTDAYIRQKAVSGELRIANGRHAGWGGVTYFDIDGLERARISASAYTLSIPLTGTSATFSGNVTVGAGLSGIFIPGTGSGGINLYGAYSGSPSNPGFTIINNAGTVTMSHNSNGGQTNLGGHLVGTSAAFSGNVSSTGSYSTSTALYTPHADINNNANTSTSWENAGLRLTGTTHPGMAFYIPGIYAATLSLSSSGIITASTNFHSNGNITASNLNISNWNTAYGWGNHASAGYLTSGSLSSYLALTGGTLSGSLGGTSASFSGNITAGGDITANSDARLKKDIRPLDDVTAKLRSLNAVSYRMKADNSLHIGFVAQEVEKQFPLLVRKADDTQGTLSVNYQALTAPLLKGWQEHDTLIQQQAEKIKTQEDRIARLEKELIELKNLVKQAIK